MSEYTARIHWAKSAGENYIDNRFSRGHTWSFDGGVTVPASPSPHVVPAPLSVAEAVDPEEAFVASLSSCHMLYFLAFAAKKQYVVEEYTDDAVGVMEKNDEGRSWMAKVTLRPRARFSGDAQPSHDELAALHQKSHELCIIANSVKSDVTVAFQKTDVTA